MKTIGLRIFGALLVLGVLWVIVPGVRADDPIDRVNETGQYQAELFQETVQQYQDLRTFADEMNSMRQDTPPAPSVAGPAAVPQVRFPARAVPQQRPMPLDPVAFQQMVRQNQDKVRQQIMQTHQEIIQQHQQQIMRVQQ